MEKAFLIRLVFVFIQLVAFGTILGLQVWLGNSRVFLNEWIRTVWCLIFAIVLVLSLWVEKLTEWIPYIGDQWKLAITATVFALLGFRSTLTDPRTIIAFILLGCSVIYLILICIHPETRPNFRKMRLSDIPISSDNPPSDIEIENFNKSQIKYMNMEDQPVNDENGNQI